MSSVSRPTRMLVATDRQQDRLREAGIVLLTCDTNGRTMPSTRAGADWLWSLVARSGVVLRALAGCCEAWNDQERPTPTEGVPGLWFVPIPIEERRTRTAYGVACIPCTEILDSEYFSAMCQGARLDATWCRSQLEMLPPASSTDVDRLAVLVRGAWQDEQRRCSDEQVIEDVGRELGESYEEINLLYSITRNMTEVDCPERFLSVTCEELRQQLPYAWVVALVEGTGATSEVPDHVAVAGDSSREADDLVRFGTRLVRSAAPDRPIVFGPDDPGGFGDGCATIAQPILRDGQVIGMLMAACKEADDQDASSVDMKLMSAAASHIEIFLENAGLYEDLNAMFLGTLESLTASIDAKDRYTCGHSRRVAMLSRQLAEACGCDANLVNRVHIAGLVHDVGKIGVPERVLVKPGRLDEHEVDWIRRHPEMGHRILRDIPNFEDVLEGVLHHHERWDGSGYPCSLSGNDIPRVARMIAIADAFDAMMSSRTYRRGMARSQVLAELEACSGTQFDPELVPVFLSLDFSSYGDLVEEHTAAEEDGDASRGRAA
ncbi:MAG: hypothetical protein CMJ24_02675 [Phycisphaerae bacterium]|nr:hypothetical protein [Phycisphaerae bacterium]